MSQNSCTSRKSLERVPTSIIHNLLLDYRYKIDNLDSDMRSSISGRLLLKLYKTLEDEFLTRTQSNDPEALKLQVSLNLESKDISSTKTDSILPEPAEHSSFALDHYEECESSASSRISVDTQYNCSSINLRLEKKLVTIFRTDENKQEKINFAKKPSVIESEKCFCNKTKLYPEITADNWRREMKKINRDLGKTEKVSTSIQTFKGSSQNPVRKRKSSLWENSSDSYEEEEEEINKPEEKSSTNSFFSTLSSKDGASNLTNKNIIIPFQQNDSFSSNRRSFLKLHRKRTVNQRRLKHELFRRISDSDGSSVSGLVCTRPRQNENFNQILRIGSAIIEFLEKIL